MKLSLLRMVPEGHKLPAGYDVAFAEGGVSACYPIPLNRIVSGLRKWIVSIPIPPQNEQAETLPEQLAAEYNKGIEEGERRYRASLSNIRSEEWKKGFTSGFELGQTQTRNQMTEIIAAEIKKAMDKEVLQGRWWVEAPDAQGERR